MSGPGVPGNVPTTGPGVPTSDAGWPGWMQPTDAGSEINRLTFMVAQQLGLVRTALPVQVKSCTNSGGISPVGTVDVQPLVKMMDAAGNTTSHGTIYKYPYCRLQGGTNAIIIDPQPGDIGLAVFCDRDISTVKSTKAESPPGSWRSFSLSDGVYWGGILNGAPVQYVRFNNDGINITDKSGNTIVMDSTGITINGILFDRNQNITNIAEATSKTSVTLTKHKHHQADDSNGDTEQDVSVPFD